MSNKKLEKIDSKTIIQIEYGDPSRDGHNQFNTFFILINGEYDDFLTSLKKITEEIGFDIDNCYYDINTLTDKEYNILNKLSFFDGLPAYEYQKSKNKDMNKKINAKTYELMIVKLLNDANPELEVETVNFKNIYSTNGGYELFGF